MNRALVRADQSKALSVINGGTMESAGQKSLNDNETGTRKRYRKKSIRLLLK